MCYISKNLKLTKAAYMQLPQVNKQVNKQTNKQRTHSIEWLGETQKIETFIVRSHFI